MMPTPVDVLLMVAPAAYVLGIIVAVLGALLACFGAFLLWTSRTVRVNRAPGLTLLIVGLCTSGLFTYMLVMSHYGT